MKNDPTDISQAESDISQQSSDINYLEEIHRELIIKNEPETESFLERRFNYDDILLEDNIEDHPDYISKKIKFYKRNPNVCFFCKTFVQNFARHLKRKHASEPEVMKIFSLPPGDIHRKELILALRKRGNFTDTSSACVKPLKKSSYPDAKYVSCKICLGYYRSTYFWRHAKNCKKTIHNLPAIKDIEDVEENKTNIHFDNDKIREQYIGESTNEVSRMDQKIVPLSSLENGKSNALELYSSSSLIKEEDNKTKMIQSGKKTRVLVPWTVEQKEVAKSYFKSHIKANIAPKRKEIEVLKTKHPHVFQNKTWPQIKVFIQNIYRKK